MLSYQNNDTLRKFIGDNDGIDFRRPYTIKEKEQFKDILDTGKDLLVPYVKNVGLSFIYEYPISICDDYGDCIAYHVNDCNCLWEYAEFETLDGLSDYIRCATIRDYNYNENTTLRCYVFIR